jgi:hypothetical protein
MDVSAYLAYVYDNPLIILLACYLAYNFWKARQPIKEPGAFRAGTSTFIAMPNITVPCYLQRARKSS